MWYLIVVLILVFPTIPVPSTLITHMPDMGLVTVGAARAPWVCGRGVLYFSLFFPLLSAGMI